MLPPIRARSASATNNPAPPRWGSETRIPFSKMSRATEHARSGCVQNCASEELHAHLISVQTLSVAAALLEAHEATLRLERLGADQSRHALAMARAQLLPLQRAQLDAELAHRARRALDAHRARLARVHKAAQCELAAPLQQQLALPLRV